MTTIINLSCDDIDSRYLLNLHHRPKQNVTITALPSMTNTNTTKPSAPVNKKMIDVEVMVVVELDVV